MRGVAVASGVGAFAAALLALAPASLIDSRLQRATDGRLRLAEAQGSVWSGAGWLELRDGGSTSGIAKRLAWRVLPGSLLRGHLVAEVALDSSARAFPVTLSLAGVEIAGARFDLPAAALGLGVPKLAPLRLTGELQIDISHLALAPGRMDGSATLQWRMAGSALTPVAPLGDYELRMSAAGPALQLALGTLEGPLQLDGKGTWSTGARPDFIVTALVPAPQRGPLEPLLRMIAVERGAGRFELSSSAAAFGL